MQHENVFASKAVGRMVTKYVERNGISDPENVDLINKMTLEGLKYDFFSKKHGKAEKSISEKSFDIEVSEGSVNYRILGFIDNLFLFKTKSVALIRDFKTSKQIFSKGEIEDNLQNLIYCLAVKHLYPEYMKRDMEFLFLKYDCFNEGALSMEEISDDELAGFEMFLTAIQEIINNFDDRTANSSFAYDKGYPTKDEGFSGRVVCGRADFAGQLKKDGVPMWFCPYKFEFEYYAVLNSDKEVIKSFFDEDEAWRELKKLNGSTVEKRFYGGCPRFQFLNKKKLDNYDPFL
jgi:hypothetical protein